MKFLLIVIFSLGFAHMTNSVEEKPPALAGILANSGFQPTVLVKDRFITGSCSNVSGVSAFGDDRSIGYFSNGENIIGFEDGIILSTGDVKAAQGPNDFTETTTSFNNTDGDVDLNKFASNIIFDATGIEFDFVPLEDEVTFRYVFASEEYCEFVGSIFNDVFGFFVSGPGIDGPFENGAINVARLPDNDEFVTINTVNFQNNSDLFVQNETASESSNCNAGSEGAKVPFIQYDGFTVPLVAKIKVVPCETYHIKLAVGDVADDKLDSAVFLESSSFDLGEVPTVRAAVPDSPEEPIAFESCRDGQFIFKRPGGTDLDEPYDIDFIIAGGSQADEGLDFQPIPKMISIPANELEYILPIELIEDGFKEDPEILRLEIVMDCTCNNRDRAELIIADLDSLEGDFNEIFVCEDQPFEVTPEIIGGAPPYSFEWDNGTTGPVLMEQVSVPTHFTAQVLDACGDTAKIIVGATIQSLPTSQLSGDSVLCLGDTVFLHFDLSGHAPWKVTFENEAGEKTTVGDILSAPYALPITRPGMYANIGFEDAFCMGEAMGNAAYDWAVGDVDFEVKPLDCPIERDGEIRIIVDQLVEPISVRLNDQLIDSLHVKNLAAGNYIIEIENGLGCAGIYEVEVPLSENQADDCKSFEIFAPNVFTPNDDEINDVFNFYLKPGHNIRRIDKVEIFDRWGSRLVTRSRLSSTPEVEVWDGKLGGNTALPGVYVWRAVLDLGGELEVINGHFTILY